MSFLSTLIYTIKKSSKISKLQHSIAVFPRVDNVSNMLDDFDSKDKLLNSYFDVCLEDPGVLKIMNDYQTSKGDLRQIYDKLLELGAGQWAGGHYVALSAIAYVQTLEYVIKKKKMDEFNTEVANNLIIYFEKRMGAIPVEWM